jgi:peptide/nickel transport system substrate-binding protein
MTRPAAVPGSLVLLLALAGLAACGDRGAPGERAAAGRTPERGGTAVVAELADIEKPMPLITESSLDNQVSAIMYMALLYPEWEDGALVFRTAAESPMSLARSFEYFGPDSASIRYRMRSDVTWSDGVPITAHDAVWTIETQGNPAVASPRQDYNRQIRQVLAEDDSTLVVHFERHYPEILFHTAGSVAPRHVFAEHDPSQLRSHPAVNNPAGNLVVSGPFRIGEWVRGQRVVLERNPTFQPAANLDRVVIRVIPEETTRLIELQTGNLDMMSPVGFDKVELIRRSGNIRLERREKRFYEYVAYNGQQFAPFADRDIRYAMGMALDVQGVMDALQMEEWTQRAGGPYSPIFRELHDAERQAPLPYDTARARAIFEQKGWTRGPDGILRNAQGQLFRFTILTNTGNQRRMDAIQVLQQQWRQVGVDARIQLLETNTFFDRQLRKNFEAILGGWGVALSPDLTGLWGRDVPFNLVSYDDPQTFALFEQALAQPTQAQAAPLWRQAAERIVAAQPYTFLYYYDELVGVSDRLQGTRIDTLSSLQRMWEWWIPQDQQRGGQSGPAAGQ